MQERDSDFFSSTQSMTNQPDNVEETTMPSEQPVQQPLQIEDATFIPETTDTPTGNAGTEEPAMEEQAEQTERSLEEISMADADELDEPKEEEAEQTEASLADAAEIDQPNEDEATNEEETEEETEAVRIKRSGNIFFVGVPIGNDGDITLRAIRTLANADVVVCEEAKVGARIMRTHNISAKLMEMNEHNEEEATEEVIALLNAGKTVAVISDAGLPLVADPGATLVQKLRELKLRPTVIPGVSSITTALMVSGFGIDEFDMVGFLPRKIGERELAARALRLRTRTVVILETPYRLRSLLSILADAMPLRPAALAMNLLGANRTLVWWMPGPVLTGQQSLTSVLPKGVWPVLGAVAIVVVLLALWQGRRLGPVVPEPLPVAVLASETTEGRARIYRRNRTRSLAASHLRELAVSDITTRLGLPAGTGTEATVVAVAAATGRSADEVDRVLYGPPPERDDDLVTLGRRLADITEEVRRS